jgi:hypothetical protein
VTAAQAILIHVATLLLGTGWCLLAFFSLFMAGHLRAYGPEGWWPVIGAIALPFAVGALYAWRGWSIVGAPAWLSGILVSLPGVFAALAWGPEVLHELSARRLQSTKGASYYLTRQGIEVGSELIQGCDPATFQVIDGPYSRDRSRVFYYAQEVSGADPETFTVVDLDNDMPAFVARDREHFYLKAQLAPELGPDATGWTAQREREAALAFGAGTAFLLVESTVLEVPEADASLRFVEQEAGEPCGSQYLADAAHVYHYDRDWERSTWRVKVVDADPATFRIACEPAQDEDAPPFDAQDASRKFKDGAVVE